MQDPANASQHILQIPLDLDRRLPAKTPTTGVPGAKRAKGGTTRSDSAPQGARRDSPIRQLRLSAGPAGAWGQSPHKKDVWATPSLQQSLATLAISRSAQMYPAC